MLNWSEGIVGVVIMAIRARQEPLPERTALNVKGKVIFSVVIGMEATVKGGRGQRRVEARLPPPEVFMGAPMLVSLETTAGEGAKQTHDTTELLLWALWQERPGLVVVPKV